MTDKQKLFCQYYIKNFNATLAYIKAYGCDYDIANANSNRLMVKDSIREEIQKLKEIKKQSIMLDEDDIVERYMKIAFADMTDFAIWGQEEKIVIGQFGPIEVKNPITGEKELLKENVNVVKFKNSNQVDGGLICQIKQGKDGASIKLEDRQKALDWLANYFIMNPMNKHKIEFDKKKLQLEEKKMNTESNTDDKDKAIKEFLEATRPTKEFIDSVFDDDKIQK